ncbi:MAG: hypothetical protein AAF404_00010 [Pseudomonadota bacterium]
MPIKYLVALAICFASMNAGAQYRNNVDLISLHYDHAPDLDDGHATVSALVVTRHFSIRPHVVSGAYGDGNKDRYVNAAEQVMQVTWGNDWLNAHADWSAAVANTTSVWLNTLKNGGDIYVAEGGQSDFTADVIRQIKQQSSFNTSQRITVIQHSLINEANANQNDLKYVKSNSNYLKIKDGNSENETADLHQPSATFAAKARASYFAVQWNAAFNYLNPQRKLDFSDTVELLYILGIGKNQVADPDDFARMFITADAPPPLPGDTTAETSNDASPEVTNEAPAPTETPDDPAAPLFPACSASITDPDGDGYGWENQQTCTISPQAVAPPAVTADVTPTATDDPAAPLFPACSASITDPDGDGYGWENQQTCTISTQIVPAPTVTPAVTPTPVVTVNTPNFPVCSADVVDSDADGYGWENYRSCQIPTSPASNDDDATAAAPSPTVPVLVFPACSGTAADEDGDGFGWENGQTCQVDNSTPDPVSDQPTEASCDTGAENASCSGDETPDTANADNTSQTADNPTAVTLVTMPACSADAVDEDGDGYSFENGASCIMSTSLSQVTALITFPSCSSAIIDTDNDGYGWENGQSCVFGFSQNTQNNPPASDVAIVTFPTCSAAVVDTDSDGYGWENNASCMIDSSVSSGTTQKAVSGFIFPVCSSAAASNQSDGYGWENEQTCIFPDRFADPSVLQPMPSCNQGIVDSDNDGYGWQDGATCVFR